MISLITPNDKILLVTSANCSVDSQVFFVEHQVPGAPGPLEKQLTKVTLATTTEITSGPSSSTRRNIHSMFIRNTDSANTVNVTVQFSSNAVLFELFHGTLVPNLHLLYSEAKGFFLRSDSFTSGGGVTSVAGKTGAVSLDTYDISENLSSNLWFTAGRVRANISNTAPINYDSTTGVISHAVSGVTASGYGDAATVPKVVIDDKGHTTSVTNTAIAISANQITSGILSVPRGGTGQTAITVNGSLLIGNTVSGSFDVNTLTQGQNIVITNDKGSITVAANLILATDQANAAFDKANGAFSQANTANVTGQAAFDKANTANVTGQAAFDKANTANITGQAAFDKANTSNVLSVAGRGGIVVLNTNDVTENAAGPFYFTAARVRSNISNTAPINYDSTTGNISHALSGVTASGYGDATMVPKIVVDDKGHVTSVTNTAIAISASAITSGTLVVARGGTGQTAITVNGSLLIGNTVSGGFDVNTLTEGTGIIITNDKGSITIAANGASATDQYARDKANGAVQTAFVTIAANGTNLVPASNNDTLTISGTAANGINVSANVISKTLDLRLRDSGVTASGYGDANTVPKIVVDAFGRVTSVVNTAIAISTDAIISGTLAVVRGGTGQTAITVNGSLLIGNTVSGGFDVNPLTAGSGITINNLPGSIEIISTGSTDQFARDQANAAFAQANGAYAQANAAYGGQGTVELDFGAFPGRSDANVVVTGQTTIVSGSLIDTYLRPTATADHTADEHMLETIRVIAGTIVPGTGFTVYGFNTSTLFEAPLGQGSGQSQKRDYGGGRGTIIWGKWTVAWRWS